MSNYTLIHGSVIIPLYLICLLYIAISYIKIDYVKLAETY